jgi:hypothetical protein
MVGRSRPLRSKKLSDSVAAPQPRIDGSIRFRLIRVRSPLLAESHLLSFPPGTKMFQFPGCPPDRLCVHLPVTRHYPGRVPPFGNLEIIALMQLPRAYRRCRVLRRHFAPRHPPDALYSLKRNRPTKQQERWTSHQAPTKANNNKTNNQKPMLLNERPTQLSKDNS